jgi:hypothetical protein
LVFGQAQPLRRLITPLPGVFDQTFFEKVCGQAFFKKSLCGLQDGLSGSDEGSDIEYQM